MPEVKPYKPKNHVRIVTAASLFDGHDAAINIMRRIIQATGAEVIHLGHDRSVQEIVDTAIQEDAQAIAVTSYQGGHMEYFKYMKDLLRERGADHIKIFGGGGGTILPDEIEELHKYGITRIYAPDDGRSMGLQGMINDLISQITPPASSPPAPKGGDQRTILSIDNGLRQHVQQKDPLTIGQLISLAENHPDVYQENYAPLLNGHDSVPPLGARGPVAAGLAQPVIPVLGITGTGGAGKSSLIDELVRRFLIDFSSSPPQSPSQTHKASQGGGNSGGKTIAIISVDPSKRKTGGALLGDRIRMNSVYDSRVYMRSLATRQANLALSSHVKDAISILKAAQFDLIILETSGIGQSDTEIVDHSDLSLYVMTPEYGAASQLEKIDMLDFADIVALNKFDKRGAMDALRDVKKQYKRNHKLFDTPDEKIPVFGTIASQFNDPGVNKLYKALMDKIVEKTGADLKSDFHQTEEMSEKIYIIPPPRVRYLSEIAENNRAYDKWVDEQCAIAEKMFGLNEAIVLFGGGDQLTTPAFGDPSLAGEELTTPPSGHASLAGGELTTPPSLREGTPPLQGGELPRAKESVRLMNLPQLKSLRKELRSNMTPAEAKLWGLLKSSQLDGRKFRRQHGVGEYILDFYCPEEKLGVELDGQPHFEPGADTFDYDRQLFIEHFGIKIIRFENKQVFEHPENVLQAIRAEFGWSSRMSIESSSPPAKEGWPEAGVVPVKEGSTQSGVVLELTKHFHALKSQLSPANWELISFWPDKAKALHADDYTYHVRGKAITVKTFTESLSHTKIPKLAVPKYRNWGDILRWQLQENLPGTFPYTAGVYPFKRELEDPTRMFAGEGGPERTNKRFHYVSLGLPAKRLSTAFDSVTLYGRDPDYRPDIYGKVGNSGVSICCLDDAKKLYSGFNLCDPATSVSMTINGPASIITAFYMNAAIDQQCELYIREHGLEHKVEEKLKELYDDKGLPRPQYYGKERTTPPSGHPSLTGGESVIGSVPSKGAGREAGGGAGSSGSPPVKGESAKREGVLPPGNDGLGLMLLGLTGDQVLDKETYEKIKAHALHTTRGTVQADILKEDQAQNTCIFSTEFSLKLMGDVQEYFTKHKVRNFYSVSISGYHIAEAGANPISQLAFTLANGFTYVEYYLSRGMKIDDFAPNLSFFFSNGIDPEYAVIGRVARRIWAKAMREKYGANERSQMLKYHIQTSGRSLHAQEISFNDIRTTLQALYAIYDNCNSLHTNAYDEAITTPTEESVRRAMAIQLIINHELGLAKNQNPLQGSFIIEELTDLVEEAVLLEFDSITERGGVLGAMETMYQRGKIQEESLYYESLKHSGKLPIMGVNTFLSKDGSPTVLPREVIRATTDEKENQIRTLENLHSAQKDKSQVALREVQKAALHNENIFAALMDAVKCCSLGQITEALFEVGGQYRRNM